METIGHREIRSYLSEGADPQNTTNNKIRQDKGHHVQDYLELAKKVAALQFKNPEYVFLFRGQDTDYQNQKKNSTLKPTLFRPRRGEKRLPVTILERRFEFLAEAEQHLVTRYENGSEFEGAAKLKRQRILRWSILQHYGICFTPLLDVTQSLRVAASFASESATDLAFVYVLGVPNLSGSITASAEAALQIVRLSGVCPPAAVRPHIQEGYLLGEYPDMPDFKQKQHYPAFEIDFGRRVIGKFIFDPKTFWADENFPLITHAARYPNQHDPMYSLATEIKGQVGQQE